MKEYLELIVTFFKIGIMTFGGGYAMLPMIQREVVEKKGWATEEEILNYYAIGQCTPGVIAVNTATFIGDSRKGVLGGFMATLGVVKAQPDHYFDYCGGTQQLCGDRGGAHALAGIRVSVVVLVGFSVWKLMKSGVKGAFGWIVFVLTFLVSAIFGLSPVVIVVAAAVAGVISGYAEERKGAKK